MWRPSWTASAPSTRENWSSAAFDAAYAPKRVATRLGTTTQILYSLWPKASDQIANSLYKLFPEKDPKKKELEREHAFQCRVRSLLQTNTRVDVRQTVELVDQGLLFSGSYIVDRVEHSFSPGRLETNYDLYRDVLDTGRF